MLSKNILLSEVSSIFHFFLLVVLTVPVAAQVPVEVKNSDTIIEIIYPKPEQVVTAVDSTFILGNVPAETAQLAYKLFINDYFVNVHHDGGFIAFLPVIPGNFEFKLEAFLVNKEKYKHLNGHSSKQDISPEDIWEYFTKTHPVLIPEPLKTVPQDSLVIIKEINPPRGNLELRNGDRLKVSFQGTPNYRAWFAIPNVIDSVPMSEINPKIQTYWGESVFGAGAVPESLKIDGIYSGFYDIPDEARCDYESIKYFLVPISKKEILRRYYLPPYNDKDIQLLQYLTLDDSLRFDTISSYKVSINNPAYPFTVRFTDSVQIIRHRPLKGYFSIFQPEGVEALTIGAEGDWYKVQLSKIQTAWVNKNSAEKLPKGVLPPFSYLTSVRFYNTGDKLIIEFPLKGKHPYRVIEDDQRTIRIQLFGVTSDTDWIRYDFSDSQIKLATWSQPEEGLYELRLMLTSDLWGYDSYYKGNTFYFQINKPPRNIKSLFGKIIVIDPGHSSDPGAIGPTGYTEAEANLGIALALKKKLKSKGAMVIMTREDSSHVDLYDRPAIAYISNADLFISIHNNALPDGVNPFINNGSSTYYYHPHSIELARAIQKELTKTTKLGDYGLYHGNLAVNRPTQYPAVLVECAFMIIPEQEALLKTKNFHKKTAKAIVKGIEKFLKGFNNEQ